MNKRKKPIHRLTVYLTDEQVELLDTLSRKAKFSGGNKLRKAEILRAALSALSKIKGLDIEGVKDEKELTERILKTN